MGFSVVVNFDSRIFDRGVNLLEIRFAFLSRLPLRHCGSLSEIAQSCAMAKRLALPYLWALGCGMSLLGEVWSCGVDSRSMRLHSFADAQTRRRADAQTRRRADAQTRRRADAQTRRRADAQTRRRADAQTRRRADARADAQTRRRADAQTRDAQTRRRADAQTRRRADAQTRRRADAQTRTRRRADAQRCARTQTRRLLRLMSYSSQKPLNPVTAVLILR